MSNVIDELKIVFSAETGPLSVGIMNVSRQLAALQGMSGASQTSLKLLSETFSGVMAGVSTKAYAAGADAGAAFAAGLRSMQGVVGSAASGLAATASGAFNRGNYGASGGSTGVKGISKPSGGTDMVGFNLVSAKESAVKSADATRAYEVKVPINIDGVKLGEACIKAMDRVSGMTGRAWLSV